MSTTARHNHEIDYKLYGEELQFVEIELDPYRSFNRSKRSALASGK